MLVGEIAYNPSIHRLFVDVGNVHELVLFFFSSSFFCEDVVHHHHVQLQGHLFMQHVQDAVRKLEVGPFPDRGGTTTTSTRSGTITRGSAISRVRITTRVSTTTRGGNIGRENSGGSITAGGGITGGGITGHQWCGGRGPPWGGSKWEGVSGLRVQGCGERGEYVLQQLRFQHAWRACSERQG